MGLGHLLCEDWGLPRLFHASKMQSANKTCAESCVMNASLWWLLLWVIKLRDWKEVPWVSRADLLPVQNVPTYHLWHHLFSYMDGCAGAGRAYPSFGFGVLVMELLLSSIVRWFCAYPFWCSQEFGFDIVPVIWGFPLNNILEYAKHFPYLNLHASFTMFFSLLH